MRMLLGTMLCTVLGAWMEGAAPFQDPTEGWAPVPPGRIAFLCGEQICIVRSDGSGLVRLGPDSIAIHRFSWSPDGQAFAFEAFAGGGDDIFVMRSDGSGLRSLTRTAGTGRGPDSSFDYRQRGIEVGWSSEDDPTDEANPAWSRDGDPRVIHGTRCSGGCYEIFVVKADGTQLTDLLHGTWGQLPQWKL